jgi:hypothetical protein
MFEKGVHIYSRPQLHLHMTASGLTPCIQALRGLAEREAASSAVLHCIDCLASQARSSDKQRCQLEEEVLRLRSDAKKLRSRTRKLEN